MPNGGSDCCGTCWFNRVNQGEAGYRRAFSREEAHCEIRDLPIEDPFYTYCVNHPHHRPDRDPIPIGPVFSGGIVVESGAAYYHRGYWQPSPDTEEIRQHLLNLLENRQALRSRYPWSMSTSAIIIRQLGEFRECRAIGALETIVENGPQSLVEDAQEALEKINNLQSMENQQ